MSSIRQNKVARLLQKEIARAKEGYKQKNRTALKRAFQKPEKAGQCPENSDLQD